MVVGGYYHRSSQSLFAGQRAKPVQQAPPYHDRVLSIWRTHSQSQWPVQAGSLCQLCPGFRRIQCDHLPGHLLRI